MSATDIAGLIFTISMIAVIVGGMLALFFLDSDRPKKELRRYRRCWQVADDALNEVDDITRRYTGMVESALTSELTDALRKYRQALRR